MIGKDAEAAPRFKDNLNANVRNAKDRFVDMGLSKVGMQVSRS